MHRRIVAAYSAFIILFTAMTGRLGNIINSGESAQAAATQSSYSLEIGEDRGFIYDSKLKPLVNHEIKTVLAVVPSPEAVLKLKEELPAESFEIVLPLLEGKRPTAINADKAIEGQGIDSFEFYVRNIENQSAVHILGYTDSSNSGVCGIEKGYDSLLKELGGRVSVKYFINAVNQAVGEQNAGIDDSRENKRAGIVLTIDRDIQSIVESSAAVIEKGAVVVMDVQTGKIAAMCSVPDYDVTNIEAYLDSPDSPFFNRALAAYNVGSSFKICVAAAALEAGYSSDFGYTCTGHYKLGEQRYGCHYLAGHEYLDMYTAMEKSCNPYFINLGQRIGKQKLANMAEKLGFGYALKLAEGVVSASGNFPHLSDISAGELANLSFGQGTLTATPVQMAQMLSIVANGGLSVYPSLIEGVTHDGVIIEKEEYPEPVRILSEKTAKTLRGMLENVVLQGTGQNAEPSLCMAGGKTSSAQTGVYVEGEETVHAWFVGFFPAELPKYSVVVFSEGGESGGKIPASVFRDICDRIILLENAEVSRELIY